MNIWLVLAVAAALVLIAASTRYAAADSR